VNSRDIHGENGASVFSHPPSAEVRAFWNISQAEQDLPLLNGLLPSTSAW